MADQIVLPFCCAAESEAPNPDSPSALVQVNSRQAVRFLSSPVCEQRFTTGGKGEPLNEKKNPPPTILMLELDDDTRPLLKQNLRNWGYRVIEALQEEDAIALARGVRDRPKLILLNQVKLPIDEFLNMGWRIRQGAELPRSTPIIVTAEQYGEDMEGKDVQVGESKYVAYLEDGAQLMNLLYRLCPV